MRNLLLGNSKGYGLGTLRNWLVSAKKHAASYDVGLLLCDDDAEIREFCRGLGVSVYPSFSDASPVARYYFHRCKLIHDLLQRVPYDRVLLTDTKDVVFQSNPFPRFEAKMGGMDAVLTSENIRIEHEGWILGCLKKLYGDSRIGSMIAEEVINSGVMYGKREFLADLNLVMHDEIDLSPTWSDDAGADQPALNWLVRRYKLIRERCVVATADDLCVTHLGVAGPTFQWESWNFKQNIIRGRATMDDGGIVRDDSGMAFDIVHQYDRIPVWAHKINSLFNN